jgi:TldD protein
MFSRRSFLARSSATALLSLFPRSGRAYTRHVGDLHEFPLGERHALIAQRADPKQVHTLVMRALDAARNAGAQYADVRLTRTVRQHYRVIGNSTLWHTYPRRAGWGVGEHDYAPTDKESLGVGVRAFVDGCWGFAASPFWDLEEMPILAQEAVQQASANAKVTPRQLTLAPTPVVTGSWHPPEVIDPFSISHEEKIEYLRNAFDYISQRIGPIQRGREDILNAWSELKFTRQEWVLGTSEGTYCTQERYITEPEFGFAHNHSSVAPGGWGFGFGSLHAKYPRMVAQGWEVCNATTARERIDAAIETFYNPKTPTPPPRSRPVEVGRYDIVCSANIAVQLIQNTLAQATELDRILGYEANASGTSYIQDPLSAIGTGHCEMG